jgi:hypothetical protein
MTSDLVAVPIIIRDRKPRIRLLKDDYAIEKGEHWCCTMCGFIARGKTPADAFQRLMEHFRLLKQHQQRTLFAASQPKGFA